MKRTIIYLASIICLFAYNTSCSKSSKGTVNNPPPGGGTTATVNIASMAFGTSSLTVKTGTKVTWTNSDNTTHTATSDDGTTFNTGSISAGSSVTVTVSTIGTFPYHCSFHPSMIATLVVTN